MEALLDEKDLLELVTELYSAKVVIQEGDTEQVKKEKRDRLVELRKNDKKCKSQIIQRIADSHLEYVMRRRRMKCGPHYKPHLRGRAWLRRCFCGRSC
jgi:hypothetical protein